MNKILTKIEFVTSKIKPKKTYWNELATKIANFYIEEEDGYITQISFNKNNVSGENLETELIKNTKKQIIEFLNGSRRNFDINLKIYASAFQIKVLKELINIPYGETKSYFEIAQIIGCKSSRAVGNACKNNPVALAIPCHRVIGKNKKLVGFAGGLAAKNYLLSLEKGLQIK